MDLHERVNFLTKLSAKENTWSPGLSIQEGITEGHYLVNLENYYPQEQKLSLLEHGLIKNLWTEDISHLKGLTIFLNQYLRQENIGSKSCRLHQNE